MGPLDVGLLLALLGGTVQGMRKGLLRQVGVLAGILVGLTVALRYGHVTSQWLGQVIPQAKVRQLLGPALSFVVCYLAVVVIVRLIHHLLCQSPMNWLNRVIGAGLGFVSTGVVLGCCLLAASTWIPSTGRFIHRSPVAREVVRDTLLAWELVPQDLRAMAAKWWGSVRGLLPEAPEAGGGSNTP